MSTVGVTVSLLALGGQRRVVYHLQPVFGCELLKVRSHGNAAFFIPHAAAAADDDDADGDRDL